MIPLQVLSCVYKLRQRYNSLHELPRNYQIHGHDCKVCLVIGTYVVPHTPLPDSDFSLYNLYMISPDLKFGMALRWVLTLTGSPQGL